MLYPFDFYAFIALYFTFTYNLNPEIQYYYFCLHSPLAFKVILIEAILYLPMKFPFQLFFIPLLRFRCPTTMIFLLCEACALTFLTV